MSAHVLEWLDVLRFAPFITWQQYHWLAETSTHALFGAVIHELSTHCKY